MEYRNVASRTRRRFKRAVFRVIDLSKIFKKTEKPKPKEGTKNNKEKTIRKGLKGKKEYLRREVFSAL